MNQFSISIVHKPCSSYVALQYHQEKNIKRHNDWCKSGSSICKAVWAEGNTPQHERQLEVRGTGLKILILIVIFVQTKIEKDRVKTRNGEKKKLSLIKAGSCSVWLSWLL